MELTTFGSQPAGERVAFVTIPRQLQQRTGSALLTVQAAATRYARKTRAHAERAASARFGQVSQRRGRSFLARFRRRGRLSFSLISTFCILLPTVKRTRSARYVLVHMFAPPTARRPYGERQSPALGVGWVRMHSDRADEQMRWRTHQITAVPLV